MRKPYGVCRLLAGRLKLVGQPHGVSGLVGGLALFLARTLLASSMSCEVIASRGEILTAPQLPLCLQPSFSFSGDQRLDHFNAIILAGDLCLQLLDPGLQGDALVSVGLDCFFFASLSYVSLDIFDY